MRKHTKQYIENSPPTHPSPSRGEGKGGGESLYAGFRSLNSEKGIALVMVLVLSAIALAMVSALLFMVIQGTRLSGYHRFFRTAEEAGIAGAEIAAEFIENRGTATPNLTNTQLLTSASACLTQKMSTTRAGNWTDRGNWTSCAATLEDTLIDPTTNPDLQFELSNFTIFTKVVDTIEGNTASGGLVTGGGTLGGSGVVAATAGITSPPCVPYLYRVEVLAQDTNNTRERSRYSGLYAY